QPFPQGRHALVLVNTGCGTVGDGNQPDDEIVRVAADNGLRGSRHGGTQIKAEKADAIAFRPAHRFGCRAPVWFCGVRALRGGALGGGAVGAADRGRLVAPEPDARAPPRRPRTPPNIAEATLARHAAPCRVTELHLS